MDDEAVALLRPVDDAPREPAAERPVTLALIDVALDAVPGVRWSVCVRADDGRVLLAHRADDVLSTASVGKLFLLVEVAARLEDGTLAPDALLRRHDGVAVADSGLWQHLGVDALGVEDLAVLVAAVSDNLATNVLLEHVGQPAVDARARSLGMTASALHDRVRDVRGPQHPARLSSGSASELSSLVADLVAGRCVSPAVSARVVRWLRTGVDLSMVGSAFGLDPLAHVDPDRGVALLAKTGTDSTVRADVGAVCAGGRTLAYAVLAGWSPGADPRDDVLAAMRDVGTVLRRVLALP